MEGTGANLRLPLNPPFFFESGVTYDQTTGAGSAGSGFAGLVPGTTPTGNVRAYDPEPAPAVHASVERLRRVPGHPGAVGAGRLRRPQRRPPGHAGRGQPGAPRRRRSRRPGRPRTTRRPLFGAQPLVTTIATTAARVGQQVQLDAGEPAAALVEGPRVPASYTLAKGTTNNRGFYGVFGGTGLQGVTSATEGAYWQNTYDPEAEWGPMFHDVRHNLVLSATYELPIGKGRQWGTEWSGVTKRCSAAGAERHLPGPLRPAHHRHRRPRAARCRASAAPSGPNCVGDRKPVGPVDRPLARHQRVRGRAARHVRQLPGGRRARTRLHEPRPRADEEVRRRRSALRRVPDRGVQRPQPPELRPAGARHLGPEHLRHHHATRSARRASSSWR